MSTAIPLGPTPTNTVAARRRWGAWGVVTVITAYAALVACGTEAVAPIQMGSLQVTVTTAGTDLDADGYTLQLGSDSRDVAVNGTVTFANLPSGEHTVQLTGLAPNCSADATTRTVMVSAESTASAAFDVSCVALVGTLEVVTVSSGTDLDPNGYTVEVDGSALTSAIDLNDAVTFADLSVGDHTVQLTGLAGNCATTSPNPNTATVTSGDLTTVTFDITCAAITGNLQVFVVTTGLDRDADGYEVEIDGGATVRQVGAVEGFTIGLLPGDHTLALNGIAANCFLRPFPDETQVTVTPNGLTIARLFVYCNGLDGELLVQTVTTGVDTDPDGYTVSIDNGAVTQQVAATDDVPLTLPVGDHTVELTGLASNCTLQSSSVVPVTIVPGSRSASFSVHCTSTTGTLQVFTLTSGSNPDPDGYLVSVDGAAGVPIGSTGNVTVSDLAVGMTIVTLSDIAPNCTGPGPIQAVVRPGTSEVQLPVRCTPPTGDLRVAVRTDGAEPDPDGYTVTVDGTTSQTVGVNDDVVFSGLAVGNHTVELSFVASNCTLGFTNPSVVELQAGRDAWLIRNVSCPATTGELRVHTNTSGTNLDADGYTVALDGGPAQAIGVNDVITFSGISTATHSVTLTGRAGNCINVNSVTQFASVDPSGGDVTFEIACTPASTDLQVLTVTTGSDRDPDGYTVTIDGTTTQSIGVEGLVSFAGLASGNHNAVLGDIASNCSVTNGNQATVAAPDTLTFTVQCSALTGALTVFTVTHGAELDPDGYQVSVDGGAAQAIATGGDLVFAGLTAGAHTVTLSDVAANCTVTNGTVGNATAPGTWTFFIDCSATTADLEIFTVTTGDDQDPDGYSVRIDQGPGPSIDIAGKVTFPAVDVGNQTVLLEGLAQNCSVAGNNPVVVNVEPSGTAHTIVVHCTALTAPIRVIVTTHGHDRDADGFAITLDGTTTLAVDPVGGVVFANVPLGNHSVELSGLDPNCTVASNPANVTLSVGGAEIDFGVRCSATTRSLQVYTITSGTNLDPDGYTALVDGSSSQPIDATGFVSFPSLTSGDHSLELTGLAPNCSASGNPATVKVSSGAIPQGWGFWIKCR